MRYPFLQSAALPSDHGSTPSDGCSYTWINPEYELPCSVFGYWRKNCQTISGSTRRSIRHPKIAVFPIQYEKKRLTKSPKIYMCDSGLLHEVLGIPGWNSLIGHPLYGYSWESLCIENIIASLKPSPLQFLSHISRGWDRFIARDRQSEDSLGV